MKKILNVRGRKVVLRISQDKDDDSIVRFSVRSPLCEDIDLTIRKLSYMSQPWTAIGPPVFSLKEKDGTHLYINNHLDIDTCTLIGRITDNNERVNMRLTEGFKRLIQSTCFTTSDAEFMKDKLGITIDESKPHLTKAEVGKLISMAHAETLPNPYDIYNWRMVKPINLVVYKIFQKLHMYTHGNLRTGMFQSIISDEYNMNCEYVNTYVKDKYVHNKIHMPWYVTDARDIVNNDALCIADTPQSGDAGLKVQLAVGAEIGEDGYISKSADYAISPLLANNIAFQHIAPHRMTVSSAIKDSGRFYRPDKPIVRSSIDHIDLSSVNLWSAAMCYYGWTAEDGIVITDHAAEKLTIIDEHVDSFNNIVGAQLKVEANPLSDDELIENWNELVKEEEPYINRGILGVTTGLRGPRANPQTQLISRSPQRGVITCIVKEPGHHTNPDAYHLAIVTSIVRRPRVGDKIMDSHGQKGVISKIIPRDSAPRIKVHGREVILDVISPPWVGKRACPSRILEEKLSIEAQRHRSPLLVTPEYLKDNREVWKLNNLFDIYDPYHDRVYPDVRVGCIRYYRVNQHAADKSKASGRLNINESGIVERGRRNYNFADAEFMMMSAGADNLLKEISKHVLGTDTLGVTNDYLDCLGFNVKDGRIAQIRRNLLTETISDGVLITKSLDRARSKMDPLSFDDEAREDTVLDDRLYETNGFIKVPNGMRLVIHNLALQVGAASFDPVSVEEMLNNNARLEGHDCIESEDVVLHAGNNSYIKVPKGTSLFMNDASNICINDLQQIINTLVLNFDSYRKECESGARDNILASMEYWCNIWFNKYLETLYKKVLGKNGLLRKLVFPRVKHSFHAVFSGNPDLPLDVVEVPRRIVNSMISSSEFVQFYDLDYEMTTDEINTSLRTWEPKILISRNPVHRKNNILGLRFRVWNGSTIRIHPAMVGVMDGVFDGGTGVGYFPTSLRAMRDLELFNVNQHFEMISSKKDFTTAKLSNSMSVEEASDEVRAALLFTTGITETEQDVLDISIRPKTTKTGEGKSIVQKPIIYKTKDGAQYNKLQYYCTYPLKKIRQFKRYMYGHVSFSEQGASAHDFQVMKFGAQMFGFTGNIVRNRLYAMFGPEGIPTADEIYHTGAQAGLDAKNSMSDWLKYEDLFKSMTSIQEPDKRKLVDELNLMFKNDSTHVDRVIAMLYNEQGKWNLGISVICARQMPVAHLIIKGSHTTLLRSSKVKDDGTVISQLMQTIAKAHF